MRIIIAWFLIGSAQAIRRTVQLEEVHTISSKEIADAAPSHLRSNHQRRELSFWSSFMSSVKCLTNAETRKEYNCHTHKPKAHSGGGGGAGAGGAGDGAGGASDGAGGDAANGNNGNDANGNNAGNQSNGRNGSSNGTMFNLSSSWTADDNGNTFKHNESGATCTVSNEFTCNFNNNASWIVSNGGDGKNGNNNGGNGGNNGDTDVNNCSGCTTYIFSNENNNNGDDGNKDDTCTYSEGTGVSCSDQFFYGFDLYNLADAAPTPSPTFQNSISNDSPEITAREGISSISPNQLYGALTISGIAVIAALLARKRRQDVDLNDEHLLNGAVGKRQKVFGKVFSKSTLEETPGATHYVKA